MSSLFAKNESSVDRTLRFIGGVVLLALLFAGPHTKWGLLGLVLIVTAVTGTCPVYSVLGISTCSVRQRT